MTATRTRDRIPASAADGIGYVRFALSSQDARTVHAIHHKGERVALCGRKVPWASYGEHDRLPLCARCHAVAAAEFLAEQQDGAGDTQTVTPLNAHDPLILDLAHRILARVADYDLETETGRAVAHESVARELGKIYVKHLRRTAFALGQGIPATDRATVTRQAIDAAILRVLLADIPEKV